MSKSDPDSAIFMEDQEADVKRKITKGYCPEKELERLDKETGKMKKINPIMDYV